MSRASSLLGPSSLLVMLGALALGGCAGPNGGVGGGSGDGGEPIPSEEARPDDGPTADKPAREWLGQWAPLRDHLDASPAPVQDLRLQRGLHLEVRAFRITGAGVLLPSDEPVAGEAIIVMEGRGVLTVDGRAEVVEPGTVAILPQGSRGPLRGDGREPLLGLLARGRLPRNPDDGDDGDAGEARILRDLEVFPDPVSKPRKGNAVHLLGSLPGLSVRTVGVSGEIPPHFHETHDEFVLLVAGRGSLGLGSEGGARSFVVQPLHEEGMVFIPARHPHSFGDTAHPSGRSVAFSIHAPALARSEDDFVLIERRQQ